MKAAASWVVTRPNLSADAVVVALGSYSPVLLKRYGIRLPVYPVKGYSPTSPITDAARAAESTVERQSG